MGFTFKCVDPKTGEELPCNDSSSSFRQSLSDIHKLQQHILCGRVDVPALTRKNRSTFRVFKRACVVGTCKESIMSLGSGTLARRAGMWVGGKSTEVPAAGFG